MKKILSLTILILIVIGSLPISVLAQVPDRTYLGLIISPTIQEYKAKKGEVIEGTFRVTHDFQDLTREVTLYPFSQDFTSDGISGSPKWVSYKDPLEPKIENSMEDWFSFEKESFTLQRNGKFFDLKYKITVPDNLSGGTYYAGVIFTENPTETKAGSNTVGINAKLAGLVFVEVEGTKTKELNVDEIKVSDINGIAPWFNLYEYLPVNIDLKIQNNGNVNIAPSGDIFISNAGTIAKIPTLQFNEDGSRILAKSTRVMRASWVDGFFTISKNTLEPDATLFDKIFNQYTLNLNFGKPFRLGAYDINVKVNYTDVNNEFRSKDAKITIFILPWKMILLVILLIVIYIVIKKLRLRITQNVLNKRKEKQSKKKAETKPTDK